MVWNCFCHTSSYDFQRSTPISNLLRMLRNSFGWTKLFLLFQIFHAGEKPSVFALVKVDDRKDIQLGKSAWSVLHSKFKAHFVPSLKENDKRRQANAPTSEDWIPEPTQMLPMWYSLKLQKIIYNTTHNSNFFKNCHKSEIIKWKKLFYLRFSSFIIYMRVILDLRKTYLFNYNCFYLSCW